MAEDPKAALVERKLALLVQYTDELSEVLGQDARDLRGNVQRRAVERLVQLVVEVSVDVNGILASMNGMSAPATSRRSFEAALDAKAVSEPLVRRFKATYVGLRNRIVHDYDRIDDAIVARSASKLVDDAREYARQVKAYVDSSGG